MPATTPNNALPYPVAADNNNVPLDMKNLAEKLDGTVALPLSGIFATKGVTFVNHGGTASVARPVGWGMVIWYGSVQPTNMVAPDICIRTDLAV
jgi:hypothetical protein